MEALKSGILAIGVALGGWFIGDGIVTFRKMDQVVEVRGLDERIVTSNEGSLDLRYTVSAPTLKELSSEMTAAQAKVDEFLAEQAIPPESIQRVAVTISDNIQNRTFMEVSPNGRYSARAGVIISSKDVNKIQSLSQNTDKLVAKGVAPESIFPRFVFTELASIKPKMVEAATKGAREAAESFARDSGSKLGNIKSASQGLFTMSAPGTDYDDPSALQKRVRVVTKVSYYMN